MIWKNESVLLRRIHNPLISFSLGSVVLRNIFEEAVPLEVRKRIPKLLLSREIVITSVEI
jgi:hypothetical protein